MILGIIGVGKMGSSLAKGVLEKQKDARIVCFDKNAVAKNNLTGTGIEWAETAIEVVEKSDAVLLAVKPQDVKQLLAEISKAAEKRGVLFVSIAAGLPIAFFEKQLGEKTRIARVIPNLPAIVGTSAACYCLSPNCSEKDEVTVRSLFESVGKAWPVKEELMDAVTAVSGCGSAYFALLAKEMAKAGEKLGLDEKLAEELAVQTLVGTGALLEKEKISPAELVKRVASPSGTTEAALKEFEAQEFSKTVEKALAAARNRGKELGSK